MNKKIKYILISVLLVLILIFISFIYIYNYDNLRFKYEYEIINYMKYDNGKKIKVKINKSNNIKYVDNKEVLDLFNNYTGVLYMGYSDCPWCRNAVPILLDTLKENHYKNIKYYNIHNANNETINKLIEILNEYLDSDKEGNKKIYVPDVYFIKNGKVMYHKIATVDSYRNPFKGMNKKQINELKNIYQNGIDLIKEN